MRKIALALTAAAAGLSLIAPADATIVNMDWSISGDASGTFSTVLDTDLGTLSLSAMDFTVPGGSTLFTGSNAGIISLFPPDVFTVGGIADGGAVGSLSAGPEDDFYFVLFASAFLQSGSVQTTNMTFLLPGDFPQEADIAITLLPAPTEVPEPATWAMMLLGFGGVGFAFRRQKSASLRAA